MITGINVQIQPFYGSMAQYIELSISQFKQVGLKTVSSGLEGEKAVLEYKGLFQGRILHWYSRAVKKGGFVYLVTATDDQNSWKTNESKLKSVVDSFELTR